MNQILGNTDAWYAVDGDNTLRVNYPLTKDSVVFDIGAFDGGWGSSFQQRYGCIVYGFEPVKEFFEMAQKKADTRFRVYHHGVGHKTEKVTICLVSNSSSFYREDGDRELVQLKSFADTVVDLKIDHIDLVKINIEGGEYDLLDHILYLRWQRNITDLQIQFHKMDGRSEDRRQAIREVLSKTHVLTYDYPFVWENWRMK